MTERPRTENIAAEEAPELHNAEQDERHVQAQDVAEDALHGAGRTGSPLDSVKREGGGEVMDDSSQDLIDRMRDMESSGRIDMGAFAGEPNMDDDDETYGEGHDPDED